MKSLDNPIHPGIYVREAILPSGITVKAAAERLGIGRPALSNFLNGKSALSPEMAVRLEKAFGTDRSRLLEMQAAYDRNLRANGDKEIVVRAFVPNFLTIKAWQIEDWADKQLEARSHLPVLLRKLVHSTCSNLHQVDFPGYDNAQRKGADGFIEAGAATPWIPEGISYWEFGTNKKPGDKAESDYISRLASIDLATRSQSAFVFVTPRNWHGKTDWEKRKKEAGDWNDVRVFDASDLEQWLEQSVPAQIWLAEQLGLPISGYETLEQAWVRWAYACEPYLSPEIFAPSVTMCRVQFKEWLEKPSNGYYVVAADSRDEAMAFLTCLFNDSELCQYKDLAAIFTSPSSLRTLIASSVPFIPIINSEEAERELIDAHRRLHCIVFRPRNAVDIEANISLDLLSHDTFKKALTSMGLEDDDIDKLARESGRSPTILRRRLSPQNSALKTPVWASTHAIAAPLVPLALIGTWHAETKADRDIISHLADKEYQEVEEDVAHLLRYDDSPVWSTGAYRGVTSKIDSIYAIAGMITREILKKFIFIAENVLSESDPALELPESDRWAAAVYNKVRDHSNALRAGICETLVILSVNGNNLFESRLGIDVASQVALLVRKLLTPLSEKKLLSQERDLPHYAEAAPDEFLKIIEEDLRQGEPMVLRLLKPVDKSSYFASPSRTGLLWALECLAWCPKYLSRVSLILAELALLEIDDNWANKPDASLQAIFRSWMPQTAASIEQRGKVLVMIAKRFPKVGWELCLEQIKQGSRIGFDSYKPRWRSDASGAGQVVSRKEMIDFTLVALKLLIDWPTHNEKTLGDLVESLQGMPEEDKEKVWDMIDVWSQQAQEPDKAVLRERIRRFALTRRGRNRELSKSIRDRALEAYDKLRPHDPVTRHSWLFANQWVQESVSEIEDESLDYHERDVRINRLRREAMSEIWADRGFSGIKELISISDAPWIVGHFVASCFIDMKSRIGFAKHCLLLDGALQRKAELCLQGFLSAIGNDSCVVVIQAAASELSVKEGIQLFTCAPFQAATWRVLDNYGKDIREGYWKTVLPSFGRFESAELSELIDCLLEVQRPRAAFHAACLGLSNVETSRLRRLLLDIATVNNEPADQFKFDSYNISEAFDLLDSRVGVTRTEMAQLEFMYLEALSHEKHGIPNLESQIVTSPGLFVQVLAMAYKRSDEGQDPQDWRIESPEQRSSVALAAYKLLRHISKIPGTDKNGKIDVSVLSKWITETRYLCREYGRIEIGDYCLGQMLSKAPEDEKGIWPCMEVCEVMEEISSQQLGEGFMISVYNSRGVHARKEGGEQERELAAKYRARAERLQFDYPYVGRIIESIAKSYEHEARWHDTEERVSKRLRE